jgi:interferon-stimulated gene protein
MSTLNSGEVPRKQIVSMDVEYYPNNPTHVAIVAEDGTVLFNMYFKVPKTIAMSKEKQKHLKGKRLFDYPMWKPTIESMIKDKIIVGHDLGHDFQALGIQMRNYDTIDTSEIKEYMNKKIEYRKRSLRNLARNFLKKTIQTSTSHNALEDAQTALQLVKLYQQASSKNADIPDLIEFIYPKTAINYEKNMEGLSWNDLPPLPEPDISSFVSPYQNASMPTYQTATNYAKNMEGLTFNNLPPMPEPNISSFVSPYQNASMPTYQIQRSAANYAKNMEGLTFNNLPVPTQKLQNFIGANNRRNTIRKPLYARVYNKFRKTFKR